MAEEQIIWRRKDASTTSSMASGPPTSSSSPSPPGFKFVFVETADGTSSAASRRSARVYVAKKAHARVRHERMARHQAARHQPSDKAARGALSERSWSLDGDPKSISNSLLQSFSPITLLSAASIDPFYSAARRISSFEHCLIVHCESLVSSKTIVNNVARY
jgi:hypothetical protein